MLAALETSLGKIPGSRTLRIGTRPAKQDHPFAKALAGGVGYVLQYAAGEDDPPFQERTWRKANPSLAHLPDLLAQIRKEAKRAKTDPDALAHFKALRLNMGTADIVEAVLMDAATWERIETADAMPHTGAYVLGIDLGQSAALSAAAGYWPRTGAAECFAVVPERPSLAEKGMQDGVGRLYVTMAQRGELLTAGTFTADYRALLAQVLARWGVPSAITCDR